MEELNIIPETLEPECTDKSFNRLKELQILLKKESALNDLCKTLIILLFKYSYPK